MKDLGLYIHIPFCKGKCRYCDFYSIVANDSLKSLYLDAILNHFKKSEDILSAYTIDTIYIGGGTPSIFTADMTKKLFTGFERLNLSDDCEITVEVNPGTVDKNKAAAMKSLGVNRISIGAQSFCDEELEYLGRIHNSADIIKTYKLFRKLKFGNISLDIMFAIPKQTFGSFEKTVKSVIGLGPEHISAYPLKIEDGTEFGIMLHDRQLEKFDEELDRDMYHYLIDHLPTHGYRHYEISNFARPGNESRHNLKYWDLSEYMGFGAAAHSFKDSERYRNQNDVYGYITDPGQRFETVKYDDNELMKEYMMLGFRRTDGISEASFREKFGSGPEHYFSAEIDGLICEGLITRQEGHIRLTDIGLDLANQVFIKFI
jgi:oxygen-independent coproporphyrinogen III oxidase